MVKIGLLGLMLASLLALPASAQDAPHVRVTQGELAGFIDRGTSAYLGIPFAAPPVGQMRWTAPALPAIRGVSDGFHERMFPFPPYQYHTPGNISTETAVLSFDPGFGTTWLSFQRDPSTRSIRPMPPGIPA